MGGPWGSSPAGGLALASSRTNALARWPQAQLPANRTALGIAGDYKPMVADLGGGHLLIVAFYAPNNESAHPRERAVMWRSSDFGRSWGARQVRDDLPGREWGVTALSDGTVLLTGALMAKDQAAAGQEGWGNFLFRSTDHAASFSKLKLTEPNCTAPPPPTPAIEARAAGVAPCGMTPDWEAVEVPSTGSGAGQATVLLGVCGAGEPGLAPPDNATLARLWRSTNSGQDWDRSHRPDSQGWGGGCFFGQSDSHRTRDGRLLHVVRTLTTHDNDNCAPPRIRPCKLRDVT